MWVIVTPKWDRGDGASISTLVAQDPSSIMPIGKVPVGYNLKHII